MADDSWGDWFKNLDTGRVIGAIGGAVSFGWITHLIARDGALTPAGESTSWFDRIIGFVAYPLLTIGAIGIGAFAGASFMAKGGADKITGAVDSGAKTVGGWGTSLGKALGLVSLDADPSIPQAQVMAAVDTVIENPAHQFRQLTEPLASLQPQEAQHVDAQTIFAAHPPLKTQQIGA